MIKDIVEVKNKTPMNFAPIKEVMEVYVPDIKNPNISKRNGMVYALCGSGGSGKSNLLMNLFRSPNGYREKFHNIYYFIPEVSFSSIENHPFAKHDKVYHDFDIPTLEGIYNELISKKVDDDKQEKKKKKKTKKYYDSESESEEEEEEEKEVEYSVIIVDDFADQLKTKEIQKYLSKFIIKLRHLCCGIIFTLQSYLYFPRILRKQITYTSIFKPKSIPEWYSIASELLHLNKDDALKVFNYVFDRPYTHLDIDTTSNTLYKNFNLLNLKY